MKNTCGLILLLVAAGFFEIILIIFGLGLTIGVVARKDYSLLLDHRNLTHYFDIFSFFRQIFKVSL